jgi:hypothetical protein
MAGGGNLYGPVGLAWLCKRFVDAKVAIPELRRKFNNDGRL